MAKTRIRIAASTLVLLLTVGVTCVSFAAPSLSALGRQSSRLPQRCAPGLACDQLNFVCFLGFAPGLSSEPALVSYPPNDFSKDSYLLVATASASSVSEEILLTSSGSLSATQVVFAQKISIHLLNSVLTL